MGSHSLGIDLWSIDLSAASRDSEKAVSKSALILSDEELRRASRLVDRRRAEFVVIRARLRTILGQCTGVQAARLALQTDPRGKPFLNTSPIRFSLAHTQDLALVAVAWEHDVGIDVEAIRPVRSALEIARRYFCPADAADVRDEIFLEKWTQREALLKAAGEGLAKLDATRLISFRAAREGADSKVIFAQRQWWLRTFKPTDRYVATIALDAPEFEIVNRSESELT